MPKVFIPGTIKTFPYTKEGVAAAKAHAKKHGGSVQMEKKAKKT